MGLVPLPSIDLYWSKNDMYHNKFVSALMTRDRFKSILKYLHFADNEKADQEDRLYKISQLLNLVLTNFQKILTPGAELVIDESMIPWRGRLIFRQYIPNKSHKYGVKLYKLCIIDGYTHNVIVYTGAKKRNSRDNRTISHSHEIVLNLLKSVKVGNGKILYADNFYSSIPLVRSLAQKKIWYCGTLRSNRKGIPKAFSKRLKRSEVFAQESKDKIRIIKWVDKRPVLMITTNPQHNAKLIDTGKTNKKGESVKKPTSVLDYNSAKKGVDLSDQMSAYFSVLRKSLKWYRKVAFEVLFGTAIVNAWVIYNLVKKTKIPILKFRESLAKSLAIENIGQQNTLKRHNHSLIKPPGSGRKDRKKCTGCYKKLRETLSSKEADKKTRKVITYCNDCDNKPGYCLQCFNEFHNT